MTKASFFTSSTLNTLTSCLRGELLTPQSADYDAVRAVWNGMIDTRPSLIVRCAGVADVINAVKFARQNGVRVSVRGGGHNVAGLALCEGGILIDMSPMRTVRVDPTRQTAR